MVVLGYIVDIYTSITVLLKRRGCLTCKLTYQCFTANDSRFKPSY
jgi:hypothetical protein